jgi:hypothetical protein
VGVKIAAARTLILLIGVGIGIPIGYFYRDHQQFERTQIREHITISDNAGRLAGMYEFEYDDTHQRFPVRFCESFRQFPVGTSFEYILYEDQGSCWSMGNSKLGYKYDEEKTRRNLNARGEGQGARQTGERTIEASAR